VLALGRPAEVQLLGQGHEVAQLAKFHPAAPPLTTTAHAPEPLVPASLHKQAHRNRGVHPVRFPDGARLTDSGRTGRSASVIGLADQLCGHWSFPPAWDCALLGVAILGRR
jgi:hypothetical protein